jgi:hypothetical protein
MGDFRVKLGGALRLSVMAAAGMVCLVAGDAVYAQAPGAAPVAKTMLVEPPVPLLPATLGKLTRAAEGDSGDGLGKLDAAGLSAQDKTVVTEDGLKRFSQSEYAGGAPKDAFTLTLSVYKFMDTSGAISAYDYFKKPGMRAEKLGDEAVSSGDELLLRSGVNVVRESLSAPVGNPVGAMTTLSRELIDRLPKVSGTAALAPLLPTLLPAKGFDADSVKYALGPVGYAAMGGVLPGNVVGFDKSAEAVTARSKSGGVLTLVLYPTPQIAGDHGRAIAVAMNQAVAAGTAVGTVKLRREGPLVAMTSGSWSVAEAQKMVEGIHLSSEVSFDKPMPLEFHAEVQKTYSLLMSIAIFCGIGGLAAVVIALFFGGGRALIRVMQGKPAASEPEFLRIDLRGTLGKRLGDP